MYKFLILAVLLFSCTKPPPDAPVCEQLEQHVVTDNLSGHTMLTPSPACMENLGEAECGQCAWIVSGESRFIGEAHKQIVLKKLVDTGRKDKDGKTLLGWQTQLDSETKKPIMVSSWLNDKKPWSQVKRESAYLPAEESYAPLATYIINACKKMNCSEKVDAFRIKLDSLNGLSNALKNH